MEPVLWKAGIEGAETFVQGLARLKFKLRIKILIRHPIWDESERH